MVSLRIGAADETLLDARMGVVSLGAAGEGVRRRGLLVLAGGGVGDGVRMRTYSLLTSFIVTAATEVATVEDAVDAA